MIVVGVKRSRSESDIVHLPKPTKIAKLDSGDNIPTPELKTVEVLTTLIQQLKDDVWSFILFSFVIYS